jgi:TonB-dependent SusC/RagA subfamily outer membrane receptor
MLAAACSSERVVSPAAQPQKSALLGCSWQLRSDSHDSKCPKPLLFIDGHRASWDTGTDLNPSEIATVEVVKGPTALSLYGDDAKNGVVQITTKKSKLKL